VVSFAMTDLTALTLMGQLASGSAARYRWPVPFSTWTFASALTSCMPCSFGSSPDRRSGPYAQPNGLRLDTARYRCLWHAGGKAGENDDAPT
jgi:hypothetical protein